MGFAALITWFAGVLAGLYMLTVWLIENDVTGRSAAPSKLPAPVIFGHMALALTGLGLWFAYLINDTETFAWAAFGLLGAVVLLGATMFARWIPVYRTSPPLARVPQAAGATIGIPAEGNFPVVVVAAHGLLATGTLVLVGLTVLGVGSS